MERRTRKGQAGQALVELALASVVLILLLFGAVDFARVFYASTAIQGAARVAARHGAYYDAGLNINPFLCDMTLVSECPPLGSTSFVSNDGILDEVDRALGGAGYGTVTCPGGSLQSTQQRSCLRSGCPGSASNAYTPPYASSVYPTTANQPWVYICYNTGSTATTQETAGKGSPQSTAPSCGGASGICGGFDMEVVVLMKYPLLITGEIGPTISIVGYQHMRVQGS